MVKKSGQGTGSVAVTKGCWVSCKAQQFVSGVYSLPFLQKPGITCENRVGGRKGSEQREIIILRN